MVNELRIADTSHEGLFVGEMVFGVLHHRLDGREPRLPHHLDPGMHQGIVQIVDHPQPFPVLLVKGVVADGERLFPIDTGHGAFLTSSWQAKENFSFFIPETLPAVECLFLLRRKDRVLGIGKTNPAPGPGPRAARHHQGGRRRNPKKYAQVI